MAKTIVNTRRQPKCSVGLSFIGGTGWRGHGAVHERRLRRSNGHRHHHSSSTPCGQEQHTCTIANYPRQPGPAMRGRTSDGGRAQETSGMAHLYKKGGVQEKLGPRQAPCRKPIHLCCLLGRLKPKPMSGTARAEARRTRSYSGRGVARGTDLFQ